IKRLVRADMVKPGGLMMLETACEAPEFEKVPEGVQNKIESIKQYKFSKCYVYFVKRKEDIE
ncbi:MAG: hypothetical protein IKU24_04660, partial [Clostridia bacterium]|nr:hypothetical protein [Clostridia bacterium]